MPFHFLAGAKLLHFLNLLIKNGISFSLLSIFRVLSSLSLVLLMAPFSFLEQLLFRSKIESTEIDSLVFIIGHPRSGTTYLHYLLSKDPQFSYCSIVQCFFPNTFKLFGWLPKIFFKISLPEKRHMDDLRLSYDAAFEEEFALGNQVEQSMACGYYFPQKLYHYFSKGVLLEREEDKTNWQKHWSFYLKKIAWLNNSKNLVVKSPYNICRTEAILEIFPNAKFIHIYRDPLEVYASSKKLLQKILPEMALQNWSDEMIEAFVMNSYKETFRDFLEVKESIPKNQLFELSYDSLTKSPKKQVEKAYNQLNINMLYAASRQIDSEIVSYSGYKKSEYKLDSALEAEIKKEWRFIYETYNFHE